MNLSTDTTRRYMRTLFMMLFMFATLTALTSCEPDDDNPFYLNGTWQQVAPTIDGYAAYTFYSDGTGYYYVDDYYGEDEYDFVWWTEGPSGLVIDYGYGDVYSYGYSVQRYDLYLYPDDGSNPLVFRAI